MMRFGKIMADARFLQCLTSGLNFSQPSDALFIVIFATHLFLYGKENEKRNQGITLHSYRFSSLGVLHTCL